MHKDFIELQSHHIMNRVKFHAICNNSVVVVVDDNSNNNNNNKNNIDGGFGGGVGDNDNDNNDAVNLKHSKCDRIQHMSLTREV